MCSKGNYETKNKNYEEAKENCKEKFKGHGRLFEPKSWNCTKIWETQIGGLVLMINRMKEILFMRVMAYLFPILLNGTVAIVQKAQP